MENGKETQGGVKSIFFIEVQPGENFTIDDVINGNTGPVHLYHPDDVDEDGFTSWEEVE